MGKEVKEEKSILEILAKEESRLNTIKVIFGLSYGPLIFITSIFLLAFKVYNNNFPLFLILFFFFAGGLMTSLYILMSVTSPLRSNYKQIQELFDSRNEKQLLILTETPNPKSILALYALFDLKSESANSLLKLFINNKSTSKKAQELAGLLVKKGIKLYEIDIESFETHDKIVPISKVFFINSEADLGKCMISKTQLKLSDTTVICPYCANMAKKDLLKEWILEQGICPVCRKKIVLQDCPIVERKG